jgi:hypothetical protein
MVFTSKTLNHIQTPNKYQIRFAQKFTVKYEGLGKESDAVLKIFVKWLVDGLRRDVKDRLSNMGGGGLRRLKDGHCWEQGRTFH